MTATRPNAAPAGPSGSSERFVLSLLAVLAVAFIGRVAYVLVQPNVDPAFGAPILDGRAYVEAAARILDGGSVSDGAFYLAPGYPYALAALLAVFGDAIAGVYLVQHVAVLAAAACFALVARRIGGEVAGIAAAVVTVTYGPLLFYASRPMAEAFAVAWLALALWAAYGASEGSARRAGTFALVSGLAIGVAALFRPNVLPLPLVWAGALVVAGLAARRAFGRREALAAVAMVAGAALVVVPVATRNHRASGHWVPVSSNAGMTLYHGNGPGATGIFTLPFGFSGEIADQREVATRIASSATGESLDPVEADRWWGDRAIDARLDDPLGTAALLARRALLTVSSREVSVDYAPAIDANPWRHAAPLPFGLLAALACAGLAARGWKGTGGARLWGAVVVCAAAPLVFYVSSRYRLPLAALLAVPAGVGVAAFVADARVRSRRTVGALAVAVSVAIVSYLPVARGAIDAADAVALSNRAGSWLERGDPGRARSDVERALAVDPRSTAPWFQLGLVAEAEGDPDEAASAYRRVLEADSGHAEAAGNLAGVLIRAGQPEAAIEPLLAALEARPSHRVCRVNLIVALTETGRYREALDAASAAARAGVSVPPALLEAIASARDAAASSPDPELDEEGPR